MAPNYFEKEISKAPMEEDSTKTLEKLSPGIEKPRPSNKYMTTPLEDTKNRKAPTNEHPNFTSGQECNRMLSTMSEPVISVKNENTNVVKHP